jgi:hypothetical protein
LQIEDLLARRSDLSTFVVHLTRRTDDGCSAAENLRSILEGEVIEARTPFGPAASNLEDRGPLDRKCQNCSSLQ